MNKLKYFFLLTDFGFLMYWTITALHLIPVEYLYQDHSNPLLVNWNWSFFPLDMLVSFSGLYSIRLQASGSAHWRSWALISLVLTSASGLQAVSYWAIAGDFDPTWWIPNLFLLVYPLFFISGLISKADNFRES